MENQLVEPVLIVGFAELSQKLAIQLMSKATLKMVHFDISKLRRTRRLQS